jgi:hypothetical protein
MPTSGPRGRLLASSLVVVAAGASAFAFVASASGNPATVTSTLAADSGQVSQIETTFTAAITANQEAGAPSAASYGTKANALVAAGKVAPPATSAIRSAQLADGKAALAKYFTPVQDQHEEIGLTNAVNAEASPTFRNLGSGVSKVKYDQVAVSGKTATLTVEVTIWSKTQVEQRANGPWMTADPVNVMDYNVAMVREPSGRWMVSSMAGDFAPGEGP